MPSRITDTEFLQAALIGFQHEASEIERKMAEIRTKIGGQAARSSFSPAKTAKKRVLSAAARRRIADAQRKRWAAYRKAEKKPAASAQKAAAKAVTKKRKMSPAAKKRIADANKKRWASFRAAKATAAKKSVPTKKSTPARKAAQPKKRVVVTRTKRQAPKQALATVTPAPVVAAETSTS